MKYEPKENEIILYDDGESWREGIWRNDAVFSPVHGYIKGDVRVMRMPNYGKGKGND